jgi:hypothetical protein
MQTIRGFLWALVGTMVLQGWLYADEYGTEATIFGGLALTMAVWQERIGDLFVRQSAMRTLLPRTLVQAALRETGRHPDIHTVPQLQQTLDMHHATWRSFRDAELEWMLRHANLVSTLQADPDAQTLWSAWSAKAEAAGSRLTEARVGTCNAISAVLTPAACDMFQRRLRIAEQRMADAKAARRAWDTVMDMRESVMDVGAWWNATQGSAQLNLTEFATHLSRLHDVRQREDVRIAEVLQRARHLAHYATEDPWLQRLLESLLTGQLWTTCLQHIRRREQHLRDIMVSVGVQELYQRFDEVMNASLRVSGSDEETTLIHDWFTEMSAYAWWLTEDMPTLVRRCLRHEGGECTRIGPTEIATLTARLQERDRILKDWSRRLFLGLWNALPAVAILFVVELVILVLRATPRKVRGLIRDDEPNATGRRYAIETSRGRRRRSRSQPRLQEEVPERLDT